MQKRVFSWKYAIVVGCILTFSVYVSLQIHSPNQQFPGWYRLFTWPEGITTWAIILTLLAIAEQTAYTARAAEGSQASAEAGKRAAESAFSQIRIMKDKERARLVIREVDKPEVGSPERLMNDMRSVTVRMRVSNEGNSKAFNVEAYGLLTLARDVKGVPYEMGLRQSIASIFDFTGQESSHYVYVSGLGELARGQGCTTGHGLFFEQETIKRIRDGGLFMQVSGMITYQDIFGESHQTPFLFIWRPFGNDIGGDWPVDSYWDETSPKIT